MVKRSGKRPPPPPPLAHAFAYRLDEVPRMGGPARTKLYELVKAGKLRLVKIGGRSLIEGDSLRKLLRGKPGGDQPELRRGRHNQGGVAVMLLAAVALASLAACAPQRGYYEDPQVAAARLDNSTALIGLGTSLMFGAPRYQQPMYPSHTRCYRLGPEVHCDGW